MDPRIDPCEDFYHFVCGDFIKSMQIIDEAVVVNTFTMAQNELSLDILREIASKVKPNDLSAFKKTKLYFHNCMDTGEFLYKFFCSLLYYMVNEVILI